MFFFLKCVPPQLYGKINNGKQCILSKKNLLQKSVRLNICSKSRGVITRVKHLSAICGMKFKKMFFDIRMNRRTNKQTNRRENRRRMQLIRKAHLKVPFMLKMLNRSLYYAENYFQFIFHTYSYSPLSIFLRLF